MSRMTEQTHVDVQEAARRLGGMSGDRIRRRLYEGKLEGYQVAGRWVISIVSIDEYLREHTAAGAA